MRVFLYVLVVFVSSFPVNAQEHLDQPICFTIKNNASYTVYGEVRTAQDVYSGNQGFEGAKIHHSATFRLEPKDDMPVCTTGPLYPGNKVRLILRTLFPVFECLSAIYPGAEIVINGRRRNDDTGVETWAECL